MSWNYRIVKYKDGNGCGLHEVYYDENGKPWGMTTEPCRFVADQIEKPSVIAKMLSMALKDALNQPVLKEPDHWGGKNPLDGVDTKVLSEEEIQSEDDAVKKFMNSIKKKKKKTKKGK